MSTTLIKYKDVKFRSITLSVIAKANEIIDTYRAQGFDLTLRQLYYQFVSRDLIPNSEREYKKLGDAISNGRLAGLIDWEAIRDRTRESKANSTWDSPENIIDVCARQFKIDKWKKQDNYVEVWIEKDALIGVLDSVCPDLDVRYFSCRGYTSQSSMWEASLRFKRAVLDNRTPIIFHLGDHDPSGIDMSRDIRDRLEMFGVYNLEFHRIALNMEQVQEYGPPPNPAKMTDSRFDEYLRKYGDESWELDALEPAVLAELVRSQVESVRDKFLWDLAVENEAAMRKQLVEISNRYEDVTAYLNGDEG